MNTQTLNAAHAKTVTKRRIIPVWYRGSLNIDPTQGNGKTRTDLENDIREFEAWQRKAQ